MPYCFWVVSLSVRLSRFLAYHIARNVYARILIFHMEPSHHKSCRACSAVGSASDLRARGPGFDTWSRHILSFLLLLVQVGQFSVTGRNYVHKVLVNHVEGLSLPYYFGGGGGGRGCSVTKKKVSQTAK